MKRTLPFSSNPFPPSLSCLHLGEHEWGEEKCEASRSISEGAAPLRVPQPSFGPKSRRGSRLEVRLKLLRYTGLDWQCLEMWPFSRPRVSWKAGKWVVTDEQSKGRSQRVGLKAVVRKESVVSWLYPHSVQPTKSVSYTEYSAHSIKKKSCKTGYDGGCAHFIIVTLH